MGMERVRSLQRILSKNQDIEFWREIYEGTDIFIHKILIIMARNDLLSQRYNEQARNASESAPPLDFPQSLVQRSQSLACYEEQLVLADLCP